MSTRRQIAEVYFSETCQLILPSEVIGVVVDRRRWRQPSLADDICDPMPKLRRNAKFWWGVVGRGLWSKIDAHAKHRVETIGDDG